MTAEGTFPKIAGDIAYASEANRFAGAGRYIAIGSTSNITSGTGIQNIGSVLIGAGSLSNPSILYLYGYHSHNNLERIGVTISGVNSNSTLYMGSNTGTYLFDGKLIVGSPNMPGSNFSLIYCGTGTNEVNTTFVQSTGSIANIDPGSKICILFTVSGATASSNPATYSIQSFRGGLN